MHRYFVAALAAVSIALGSSAAHATTLQVTVFETIFGLNKEVASWTQDQNPAPVDFVGDYYTTVPVYNAIGLGGDTAVTWYSGTNGQLGGFTNFSEQFNILAPTSYAFYESSPTFVPGSYYGVNLKSNLTYLPASYTITALPTPLLKAVLGQFNLDRPVPAVPEPASWAMMLVGLGLIGFVTRRRRNVLIPAADRS